MSVAIHITHAPSMSFSPHSSLLLCLHAPDALASFDYFNPTASSHRGRSDSVDSRVSDADISAPSTLSHTLFHSTKPMVNMFDIEINPVKAIFTIQHGRVELLNADTSRIQLTLLDEWMSHTPEPHPQHTKRNSKSVLPPPAATVLSDDGEWEIHCDLDSGEKLNICSSCRTIPYVMDVITNLIKYVQEEFSHTPHYVKHHPLRIIANILQKQELLQSASNTAFSKGKSSSYLSSSAQSSAFSSPALSTLPSTQTPPAFHLSHSSDPHHANNAISNLQPSSSIRPGKFHVHGQQIELKFSTVDDERDVVLMIIVDYALTLQRFMIENQSEQTDSSISAYHSATAAPTISYDLYRNFLVNIGAHVKKYLPNKLGSGSFSSNSAAAQAATNAMFPSTDGYGNNSNMSSYWVAVAQAHKNYQEGIFICRNTPEDNIDAIIKVPGFVLEMRTREFITQPIIHSYFVTYWDKPITVNGEYLPPCS